MAGSLVFSTAYISYLGSHLTIGRLLGLQVHVTASDFVFLRQFLSSRLGYRETCYTDQAGLKLTEIQLPLPKCRGMNVALTPLKTTLIFLKGSDTVKQD